MRIFIALDIPKEIRDRLSEYAERMRPLAPEARWARIEGLHVTLKFIGEVSDARVQEVKAALAQVKAKPFEVEFKDVGFFPSHASGRVFWAGVHASEALPQLASNIEDALEKLGIPKEKRPYQPHLTLAKAGEGPGAKYRFNVLRQKLDPKAPPQFGTMTAKEFYLYRSEIMRGGARYTKLERYSLDL